MNTRRPIVAPGWISMPVKNRPTCEISRASQRNPNSTAVRHRPVPHERVQPRIAGEHFPTCAGRGVPLEHDGDVFAEAVEHGPDSDIAE
jgi:hypothetical protein